jgi:hypothetical protein
MGLGGNGTRGDSSMTSVTIAMEYGIGEITGTTLTKYGRYGVNDCQE